MPKLARCPCGKTPTFLCIDGGFPARWAVVSGNCCGDWQTEFRLDFKEPDSDEGLALAIKAWNETPRGGLK